MTLRLPFCLQQLLFAAVVLLSFPGARLFGQDVVITQDGKQQAGKVLSVSPTGVQIQIGASSSITLPFSVIKEVRMPAPPEFATLLKAVESKNYDAALTILKGMEKYKGLPADWAQQASAMVGDIYIEKGDLPKAEAAYKDFQRLYPGGQGGVQAEMGQARLAVARKDFAAAKGKVEAVVAKANEDKNVNRADGLAYSQAFYLMGQIKEQEGDFGAALENYLKTVAIFYYDRSAVALAQQKADALRQANPAVFVP